MKTWKQLMAPCPWFDQNKDTLTYTKEGVKSAVYRVTAVCDVKHPDSGDWFPGVVYQDVNSLRVFVRSQDEDWSRFQVQRGEDNIFVSWEQLIGCVPDFSVLYQLVSPTGDYFWVNTRAATTVATSRTIEWVDLGAVTQDQSNLRMPIGGNWYGWSFHKPEMRA